MWIIVTILVGLLGGLVFTKAKIPAGMVIGSIVFVAAFNITTNKAFLWPQARFFAQVVIGAYMGCMNDSAFLRRLPRLFKPYLVVLSSYLVLNLIMGAAVFHLTDLDLLTCLLCAMPAGLTDTPLIALDMGADAAIVTAMQMVRVLFGLGCIPLFIDKYNRIAAKSEHRAEEAQSAQNGTRILSFLPIALIATIAGLIGHWSGIPVGALLAALLATIVTKFFIKTPPFPMRLRRVAQLVTGCCIGTTVEMSQVLQLRHMLIPAILLCATFLLCCVVMGRFMTRVFHIPPREGMLIFVPAGASEIALIAADLGVYSTDLIVLQVCRLLGVTFIFPQIFSLIVS